MGARCHRPLSKGVAGIASGSMKAEKTEVIPCVGQRSRQHTNDIFRMATYHNDEEQVWDIAWSQHKSFKWASKRKHPPELSEGIGSRQGHAVLRYNTENYYNIAFEMILDVEGLGGAAPRAF